MGLSQNDALCDRRCNQMGRSRLDGGDYGHGVLSHNARAELGSSCDGEGGRFQVGAEGEAMVGCSEIVN